MGSVHSQLANFAGWRSFFYAVIVHLIREGLAVSMDLFRRNQKIIFWIVTLIIVPSFVLVWGVGRMDRGPREANFEVGSIDGKGLEYHEFENFQKRFRAALGGVPLHFAGAPGSGTPNEELYKYLFTYQLLKDAEKAGVTASDLQVGTYIENGHPTIAPHIAKDGAQAKEKAVDNLCRQMQITRTEFVQGVRDWQTIGNYLDADANLSAVNDDTVFTFYSLNKSEVVTKTIRFPETEGLKTKAKAEIMAKPAEELDREVRDYIANHGERQRYREPARWRFAWLLAPFVPANSVRQPTEQEIRDRYEQGREYLYRAQPLTEVHDRIKSELLKEETERQTLRNFKVDIDSQLLGQGADLPPAEMVKLAQMVKFGVTSGDTGAEPLPADQVVTKIPQGSDFQLQMLLNGIDAGPAADREAIVNEWKSGFNLSGNPFKGDHGYYRLRLLDYLPSTPAQIEDADGKVKAEYYDKAIEDLVGERVTEMAREDAEAMEAKVRAYMTAKEKGEAAPDAEFAHEFAALPTETVSYLRLADSDYELGRLPIGDLLGPKPYRDAATGERGQELVVMVERRVPTRAAFDAEKDEVKNTYRNIARANYRGNYGFTYTQTGPAATIQPSPAIMGGLSDRFNKGGIKVNPELLRTREG